MDNKSEILALEKELEEADFLYYNFGKSDLSDDEYDAKEKRLQEIDPKNKRFKNGKRNVVGAKVVSKNKNAQWKKVQHDKHKMGSLAKVTSFDGLKKWENDLVGDNPRILVQHKLDGISIRLEYRNGKLVEAITRGDGNEGENIFENVKKMSGVPLTIKHDKDLSVRGEILLYKSNLDHFDGAKTSRNTAAGTAKRLDGVGCEWLNVQVYRVNNWKDFGFKKVSSSLEFLSDNGFSLVEYEIVESLDEVQKIFNEYNNGKRDKLDWDIDGLVVKAGLFEDDDWRTPKREIAYKFPPKVGITELLDVIWQDSGGRITPVACLKPVEIDGVTISRVTLNNVDYIKKLCVKIGDSVVISRRNDVIPCVEKVSTSKPNGKDIIPPTHDEDGYPIIHEKNSSGNDLVYLVSTNPNSKSKRVRRILKWFTAHGAKGIAKATIEAVINAGVASDLPDFYDVCMNGHDDLLSIDGFGAGTYKIMKRAALKTCKTDLITFLNSMDLNNVGTKILESICQKANKQLTLKEFLIFLKDAKTVASIPGIGDNTLKGLKQELNKKKEIIKEMHSRVDVEPWKPSKVKSSKVNGLSFCFTGKMSHGRTELENAVRSNSGLITGVNKNLDYLVTNDPNSGSSKNKKVDSLNAKGSKIKRITEIEFINIIGGLD